MTGPDDEENRRTDRPTGNTMYSMWYAVHILTICLASQAAKAEVWSVFAGRYLVGKQARNPHKEVKQTIRKIKRKLRCPGVPTFFAIVCEATRLAHGGQNARG